MRHLITTSRNFHRQASGASEGDTSEFIPLPSQEEEEQMNQEDIPAHLPLLPLRNTVLYPGVVAPIIIGRDKSTQLVREASQEDKLIGVVAQKDAQQEDPQPEDLYQMGTIARVIKMLRMPDGNLTVVIQGKQRFRIQEIISSTPYLIAQVETVPEPPYEMDQELDAMVNSMKEMAQQIISESPNLPSEAGSAINDIQSPRFLVHFISSNLNANAEGKQKILETLDLKKRMELAMSYLQQELQMLDVSNQIQDKVKSDIDKQQRDYFLQQQMRAIQEELGQDHPDKDVEELQKRAEEKKWPQHAREQFEKELNKMRRINPAAAEYSMMYSYLETLLDLPWEEYTQDELDLDRAKKIFDEDHYGLDKVKDRILEYLAVLKLRGDMKSPILCLHGPPGVGKTSLGRSVARALDRQYVRMALGGLRDEAEIRGHRRTYIGAMPGRIIQSIRKAKASNPVMVLDEIDKVGSDFRGDPASALLEVLDPEQNDSFYDYFLELEYDLSHVLFIATANNLDTIHPALRDRLEVIDVSGYLLEEKIEIAKRHLIPKQRKTHGLKATQFRLQKEVLEQLIDHYTREAGVRSLDKNIAALCRGKARAIVMEEEPKPSVTVEDLRSMLGPVKYEREVFHDNSIPGVVMGLAWTPAGGDILYIEVSLSPGQGRLHLTGKLGDVMKESAQTALSYLRSHYHTFNLKPSVLDVWDVHIHIPEGAVPKDGPSAGVTLLTALASAFTQRKVRKHLAMTGEITLRGSVLPVGGIKEKILAAKRIGVKEIILSRQNQKNVEEINERYIKGLQFFYVDYMHEVLDIALLKEKVKEPINVNNPPIASAPKTNAGRSPTHPS
jgi:ATP-dependent Lon protease